MSYNGSGLFLIDSTGQPVAASTLIQASVFNALTADLATGLSTAIAKDGQTTITANLPMAGYRHTGVGNASARTMYAAAGQVQDGGLCYGTVGGTADAVTLTLTPTITAYAAGQKFSFISSGANTGAVTINVNSVGAKAVTKHGATALSAGEIASGMVCLVEYDGTQFQLLNVKSVLQGLGTSDSPQFAAINLGHASDTTLTRVSAGVVAVEGTNVVMAGAATGSGITQSADRLLGRTTAGSGAIEEISIGSGLSMAAGVLQTTGGGITLGTPVVSTSGTSIDFTSIPSGVKRVTCFLRGVSVDAASAIMFQLGDSGGVETSGYVGYAGQDSTATTALSSGFQLHSAMSSGVFVGKITFEKENTSDNTWIAIGVFHREAVATRDRCTGRKSLTGGLDRLRITTVGGTAAFSAGEINITYES